jgi:hypothetical protein
MSAATRRLFVLSFLFIFPLRKRGIKGDLKSEKKNPP